MSEKFEFATVGESGGFADLIFVHGLRGDMTATWICPRSGEPSGDYWPKWICEDLPSLNVYTLGYPSSLFEKWAKKEMSLYERGKSLLDYLASYGVGERPIGFVTHSLGGLLVKQMIRTGFEAHDEAWKAIANNCRLVIFLATPHTGSSLASAFTFAFPRLGSKYLHLLRSDSSELDELNAAYRRLAPEKITNAVYYETHKTNNIAIVVKRVDADPGVFGTEIVAVDADHINICRPENRQHPIYTGVRRHVAKFASDATEPNSRTSNVRPRTLHTQKISAFVYSEQVAKNIYIVLPFDGETIFAVPIRFVMRTSGPSSVKNVYLRAELSDSFYLHNLDRSVDKLAEAREIKVVADEGRNKNIARVQYKIPSLPPDVKVDLLDYIFAKRPTVFPVETSARSKDGVPMVISSKIIVSLPITLTLDGEDVLPWCGEVQIHFRNGSIEDFSAVKRDENRLIDEISRSGARDVQPSEATFIGFSAFSQRLAGEPTILNADPTSITGVNVTITPRGLENPRQTGGLLQ